jgi:hypothetical protein
MFIRKTPEPFTMPGQVVRPFEVHVNVPSSRFDEVMDELGNAMHDLPFTKHVSIEHGHGAGERSGLFRREGVFSGAVIGRDQATLGALETMERRASAIIERNQGIFR